MDKGGFILLFIYCFVMGIYEKSSHTIALSIVALLYYILVSLVTISLPFKIIFLVVCVTIVEYLNFKDILK